MGATKSIGVATSSPWLPCYFISWARFTSPLNDIGAVRTHSRISRFVTSHPHPDPQADNNMGKT